MKSHVIGDINVEDDEDDDEDEDDDKTVKG